MEKGAKTKREARDEKLKDQKIEEQVVSSLEVAATPEDKFQLLLRKHVESERINRRLKQEMKLQEKQLESVIREKENLQREVNKSVLMRDKLQELCREQQKLIKSVKNESMQKLREEEERRKENQTKFQASINEITQSLSKNNEENLKLRDHNVEITKKLKSLAAECHTREQQLSKLDEQVRLEQQLHQAKLSKAQMEAAMEKEILIKEKELALEKWISAQHMIKELSERECELKLQLNLYTSKYDEFQSSLQKSNDVFVTYKTELEKMSKTSKKVEKESLEWKRKWEKSNATLIELATEKKERDEHAMRCNRQVEQLQKLLRALQTERTNLYKLLRDNNIETPALPSLPPEPEPLKTAPIASTADKDRMDMMSKNCAELKQTLANLQNQMKYLNKKTPEPEPVPVKQTDDVAAKKRQKKKQKSKNNKKEAVKEDSPANDLDSSPSQTTETPPAVAEDSATEAIHVENGVVTIVEAAEVIGADDEPVRSGEEDVPVESGVSKDDAAADCAEALLTPPATIIEPTAIIEQTATLAVEIVPKLSNTSI